MVMYESRGRLTNVGFRLSSMCMTMMVSVRCEPSSLPVCNYLRSALVNPSRLSDPTSNQLVPAVSASATLEVAGSFSNELAAWKPSIK